MLVSLRLLGLFCFLAGRGVEVCCLMEESGAALFSIVCIEGLKREHLVRKKSKATQQVESVLEWCTCERGVCLPRPQACV